MPTLDELCEGDDDFHRALREIRARDMPLMEKMAHQLCDTRELDRMFALDAEPKLDSNGK